MLGALDGGAQDDVGGGEVHRALAEGAARDDAAKQPAGRAHVDLRFQHQDRAGLAACQVNASLPGARSPSTSVKSTPSARGAIQPAFEVEERDLELPFQQLLVGGSATRRAPAIDDVGAHEGGDRLAVGGRHRQRRAQRVRRHRHAGGDQRRRRAAGSGRFDHREIGAAQRDQRRVDRVAAGATVGAAAEAWASTIA